MASKSKERQNKIKLSCTECKTVTYFKNKNKAIKQRLEISKFCKHCKKHTMHKETK
ncbi:MAG TPA: 50S ribosomal protein L33 [Candidatus Magasanikbacteria bacterium]|nr:50S ribosomal protein L33 [Candidatus Magasanikbacteria bacterium]